MALVLWVFCDDTSTGSQCKYPSAHGTHLSHCVPALGSGAADDNRLVLGFVNWVPQMEQKHLSNESHIVLKSVQRKSMGRYSCEVSADAPSFHTLLDSAELKVVGEFARGGVNGGGNLILLP